MELKILSEDSHLTKMAMAGKLDIQGEQAIGDDFRNALLRNNSNVLLDMTQVSYLASLGIRLLFKGAKDLAAQGKKLVVINPQPMVEDTLSSSGTAKFIPIAKSEEDALKLI